MRFISSLRSFFFSLRRSYLRDIAVTFSRGVFPPAFFRWNTMFIFRFDQVAAAVENRVTPRFRWGSPEDEPLIQRIRFREEGYRENFLRGDRVLLAEVGEEPVGCLWVEGSPLHRSRPNAYIFDVGGEGAWVYGVEIAPAWRGQGLVRPLYRTALARLRELGRARIYMAVEQDNVASLRASYALGAVLLWEYRVLRLAGITWHEAIPWVPGLGPPVRGFGSWPGSDPSVVRAEGDLPRQVAPQARPHHRPARRINSR